MQALGTDTLYEPSPKKRGLKMLVRVVPIHLVTVVITSGFWLGLIYLLFSQNATCRWDFQSAVAQSKELSKGTEGLELASTIQIRRTESLRTLSCGNSASEARDLGSVFDTLGFVWIPAPPL